LTILLPKHATVIAEEIYAIEVVIISVSADESVSAVRSARPGVNVISTDLLDLLTKIFRINREAIDEKCPQKNSGKCALKLVQAKMIWRKYCSCIP